MQTPYGFIRTIELTGRWPNDSGEWLVSVYRMRHGEGEPPRDHPSHFTRRNADGSYPHAPKLSVSFLRQYRTQAYRRIRSSDEAYYWLRRNGFGFQACFHIFPSWAYPKDGYIALPDPSEQPLKIKHCVPIEFYDPTSKRFAFHNSWGEWGYQNTGLGFLDPEYLDKFCFEAWGSYHSKGLESKYTQRSGNVRTVRFVIRDEFNRKLYCFHVLHSTDDERQAWAFVLENDGRLELEELYVHPDFRRRGHGNSLVKSILELKNLKNLPLIAWIPFSETKQESPSTFGAMTTLCRRLGLKFKQSPTNHVAYCGTTNEEGEDDPVEPSYIPGRPRSMHSVVIAAALALAGNTEVDQQAPTTGQVSVEGAFQSDAWIAMNTRRWELIQLKNRGGLNEHQRFELETLQALSLKKLTENLPQATAHDEMLRKLQFTLNSGEGH